VSARDADRIFHETWLGLAQPTPVTLRKPVSPYARSATSGVA
jgi:hypothetical protein